MPNVRPNRAAERQLVSFTLLWASFVLFVLPIANYFREKSNSVAASSATANSSWSQLFFFNSVCSLRLYKNMRDKSEIQSIFISPLPGDSMIYQHSVGGGGGGGVGGCPGGSPTNSTPPNMNATCSPSTPPLSQQPPTQQQQQQQQQQSQAGNNSSSNNNNPNPSQQNDNGSSEMVSNQNSRRWLERIL